MKLYGYFDIKRIFLAKTKNNLIIFKKKFLLFTKIRESVTVFNNFAIEDVAVTSFHRIFGDSKEQVRCLIGDDYVEDQRYNFH